MDTVLWSIDRREGDWFVLINEEEETVQVPASALPAGAEEGLMVRQEGTAYAVDEEATAARRRQVLELQNRLLGRSK